MTAYVEHFDRSYRTGFGTGLRDRIAALRAAWEDHKAYVRTRNELASLTDNDLADIGLIRSMIDAVARRSVAAR